MTPRHTECSPHYEQWEGSSLSALAIAALVVQRGLLKEAGSPHTARQCRGSSLQRRVSEEITMMKALLWILLIIFVIGVLVVTGVISLIF